MCDARFVNALSACRTRRYPSRPRRSTRPASRRAEPQAAAGRCSRSAHVTAPCGAPGELLPGSSAAFALRGSGSVQIGRRRPRAARYWVPELTHRQRLRAGEVASFPTLPVGDCGGHRHGELIRVDRLHADAGGQQEQGFRAIFASIRSSSQ